MKKEPIVIKNKSFTSINFRICFPIKVNLGDAALFALLPSILVRFNANYPSEDEFQKEKLKRNISNFGYYYYNIGATNFIQFNMQIVDPRYIGEDKIEEAFEFLLDTIYNPKVNKNKFDKKLYEKEYGKLEQNIKIRNKDIRFRAYSMALKEVDDLGYLKNDVFIDSTLLENISNGKLYSYYKEQIYTNDPLIFVLGDVTKERIKKIYDKYVKKNRKELDFTFDYNKFLLKKDDKVKKVEEKDYFHQSALVTVYKIDNMTEEDKIMMYTVVNLFSSQSAGLIRKNLRDEAGLVYGAWSQAEYSFGLITITALINSKTKKQALKQIDAAFNDIQNEKIITPLLKNIVDRCRLNLLWGLDDKKQIMSNNIKNILGYDYTDQKKYDKLKKIKPIDVIEFVKRMKLDLIYFLKGEENGK
ncbi:MAG: insulinase family protein [Bacilli bacterium]